MSVQVNSSTSGSLVIAEVVVDSPPMNIFDLSLCLDLQASLRSLKDDDKARLVIIRGSGAHFSSGVDIAGHTVESMPELLPAFHQILKSVLDLDAIVIAAVSGHCLGGGLELALACDRIIASENASLGFPEISIGCYPPAGIPQLISRVPLGRAAGMILSGEPVPVAELHRWGLVDVIAQEGELEEAIDSEIQRYNHHSPAILGLSARRIHREARQLWGHRLDTMEREYLDILLPHPDATEGVAAFLAKRPPKWTQRPGLVGPEDVAL